MRKLIEVTHVSLGGEIGSPQDWAFPYLDEEHAVYANDLLNAADVLLLGRRHLYEGLSAAYMGMAPNPFVDRMKPSSRNSWRRERWPGLPGTRRLSAGTWPTSSPTSSANRAATS